MGVRHPTLSKYILKQPCCDTLHASVFQALILLPSSMLYQTHCGNDLLPEGAKKKISLYLHECYKNVFVSSS